LDVHAMQSAYAVLDTATGELETGSVTGRPS
jgi:hypothetical protein